MPERNASKAKSPSRWWTHTKTGLSVTAWVAVIGGIAWGATFGVPVLQDRLALRTHAAAVAVTFDWPTLTPKADAKPQTKLASQSTTPAGSQLGTQPAAEPGTWLPREIQDELLATAHRELESAPNPFSQDALRQVAAALVDTGWFDAIDAIRRDRDPATGQAVLRVQARWRTPAAVVRRSGIDYLVSWSGHILPVAAQRGWSDLRVITGAEQTPIMREGQIVHGQVWPGADIKAGLELLAMVTTHAWSDQIQGVDVSEYPSTRRLAIITTRGSRVIWGGSPSEVVPGEVAAAVKLARLDALARMYEGRIDAGHRVVEVFGPITLVDNSATADATPTDRAR